MKRCRHLLYRVAAAILGEVLGVGSHATTAEIASSRFAVLDAANSIPGVGEVLLPEANSLRTAGLLFAAVARTQSWSWCCSPVRAPSSLGFRP